MPLGHAPELEQRALYARRSAAIDSDKHTVAQRQFENGSTTTHRMCTNT